MFVLAEDDADRGIFPFHLDVAVKIVDVHLHLTQVLMGELADFQVDEHVAAQEPVVKDQIHIIPTSE
jgi:hypothetical protein